MWEAQIVSKQINPKSGVIQLNVSYYDLDHPDRPVHGENLTFPPGTSRPEMLAEIKRVGEVVREKYTRKVVEETAAEVRQKARLAQANLVYSNIVEGTKINLAG